MSSKRVMGFALSFLMAFSCLMSGFLTTASAETAETEDSDVMAQYEVLADSLYMNGLFKGGDKGYDLAAEPDKVQTAVMLVRLLGSEDVVLKGDYSHPYTDVPKWAKNYIGYLYENGVMLSDDEIKLNAKDKMSSSDFIAVVLESIGHSEVSVGADPEDVKKVAVKSGLLDDKDVSLIDETEFNRGAMVYICDKALDTELSGTRMTLYDALDSKGAIKKLDEPTDEIRYGKKPEPVISKQEKASGKIIASAKSNMGVRYRSGGRSPRTGFDCSGYVGYTLIQSGVWDRYYGSCDGIMTQCTQVSKANAKPGDLVFFKGTYRGPRAYTHIGIYLGNNQFIHCSSSQGVTVSSFASGYWAGHYSCIARPTVLV